MHTTHSDVQRQLRERLARLLDRVTRIEGDLRKAHDRDWVERATELENDEVLEGLDTAGRAEVEQLRGALRRIEAGKYGFCTACGQPISEDRLLAIPTAATCIGCAA